MPLKVSTRVSARASGRGGLQGSARRPKTSTTLPFQAARPGKVAVLKSWRGQEFLLRILKEGDCFGEMAVMDLLPRSASIRAVEDCTAIRLSAASIRSTSTISSSSR